MKQRIAIVAGGFSSEHEVSLHSAKGIYDALDKNLFEARIIELPKEHDTAAIMAALQAVNEADYAYITIHGTPGENGLLQGYLEMVGIPYNCCSVLPAALTFNKYTCTHYLAAFGVHTAQSLLLRKEDYRLLSLSDSGLLSLSDSGLLSLGLPCFIKSNVGGSSFGCTKVKTPEQIVPAIEAAFKEGDEVICEQLLTGIEVTCGAFKTQEGITALPITEVVTSNEFFDYDAKYNGQVDEITPARIADPLRDEIQALTKRIYTLLGCSGIIRIDYILSPNENCPNGYQINLLEVNTTPGMTPTSFIPQQIRAAGLNLTDVLTQLIMK
ncbi:MAG: D-alanine--D-alanine ligase [Paludibacteraceae bacterium]|nr:D-alanine--D-alanine ligase [Paludibacteraceae bacterium]